MGKSLQTHTHHHVRYSGTLQDLFFVSSGSFPSLGAANTVPQGLYLSENALERSDLRLYSLVAASSKLKRSKVTNSKICLSRLLRSQILELANKHTDSSLSHKSFDV